MIKITLEDNSSICSICYRELESGKTVYVDEVDDLICTNCEQDGEHLTLYKS